VVTPSSVVDCGDVDRGDVGRGDPIRGDVNRGLVDRGVVEVQVWGGGCIIGICKIGVGDDVVGAISHIVKIVAQDRAHSDAATVVLYAAEGLGRRLSCSE